MAQTAPPDAAALEERPFGGLEDVPRIVEEVRPSVTAILVQTPQGASEGSGIIWSSDGLVITNDHVVDQASSVTVVLATGERIEGEVVARDPLADLAVLKIARDGLPAATFRDDLPRIGELAVAIGNPLGFENTVTAGIVSGLDRAIPSGGQTPALINLVQTDAPISPGNSGGALVGTDGSVIGVNVAYIPPQGGAESLGFAIPSSFAIDVIEELLDTGVVRRSFLGASLASLTPPLAEQFQLERPEGAIVLELAPDGPGVNALQPGDVIIEFDGEPVRAVEDVFSELRAREPQSTVTLRVLRNSTEQIVTVTLAERPQ